MNKRHYEHTLPNIRGSLSNTYYSGQLQYFQENPDIRRDTSRRAAQTETAQGQQQEQKKGASQAV